MVALLNRSVLGQINPAGLITKRLIGRLPAAAQINLAPRFDLETDRQFSAAMIAIAKREVLRSAAGAAEISPRLKSDGYRHPGISIGFGHIRFLFAYL